MKKVFTILFSLIISISVFGQSKEEKIKSCSKIFDADWVYSLRENDGKLLFVDSLIKYRDIFQNLNMICIDSLFGEPHEVSKKYLFKKRKMDLGYYIYDYSFNPTLTAWYIKVMFDKKVVKSVTIYIVG